MEGVPTLEKEPANIELDLAQIFIDKTADEIHNWVNRSDFQALSYEDKVTDLATLLKTERWDMGFKIPEFEDKKPEDRRLKYEEWDRDQAKKIIGKLNLETNRAEMASTIVSNVERYTKLLAKAKTENDIAYFTEHLEKAREAERPQREGLSALEASAMPKIPKPEVPVETPPSAQILNVLPPKEIPWYKKLSQKLFGVKEETPELTEADIFLRETEVPPGGLRKKQEGEKTLDLKNFG